MKIFVDDGAWGVAGTSFRPYPHWYRIVRSIGNFLINVAAVIAISALATAVFYVLAVLYHFALQ